MIRVEAVWLAVEPIDMRAGMDSLLARVVAVFGAALPHHAYCFTNARANRLCAAPAVAVAHRSRASSPDARRTG